MDAGDVFGILCHHHRGEVQKRQEQREVPVVQEGEEVRGGRLGCSVLVQEGEEVTDIHAVKTSRRQ